MDSDLEDVKDLFVYFAKKGEYDKLMAKKLFAILGRVDKEARARAIDWLTENREKRFGLDVPAVRQALRETGTMTAEYVPAEDWTCDACGMQFKLVDQPTDEDKHDRGLFDYCPRCGFQPCWTKEVELYRKNHVMPFEWEPEWYSERKAQCFKDHMPPCDPVYSRIETDKFINAEKKARAKALMAQLAAERRVS